jgi:hypothetical protein
MSYLSNVTDGRPLLRTGLLVYGMRSFIHYLH